MAISFAQAQFGKPIDEISADDLVTYFSIERDESLTLEFKSFYQREGDIRHKENGVLRTICGFLNSNGGLLIWGAPVGGKNIENQKVFTGALSPVEKRYSKDDFISKLSSRIVPFAAPVQVKPVEVESGKFVYLIDVPESEAKPHQFDNIYYMRLDGQTKFAPHYVIDALFKQVKRPELKGFLRVVSYRFVVTNGFTPPNKICLQFEVTIFNESKSVNDTGVYIEIAATLGSFIPTDNPNYLHGQKGLVFVKDASPVITYALSTQFSFDYEITSEEYTTLFREKKPLEVSIIFGSNKSITRRSDYYIILKDMFASRIENTTYTRHLDLNSLMTIQKDENISMHEVWQGSEEERRQEVLRGI